MGLEQRVRAMRRAARDSFYRQQAEWGNPPGVTNWRMLIARRLKIPVAEVRRILGEDRKLMCVRCGTGRVAACTSPDNHAGEEMETLAGLLHSSRCSADTACKRWLAGSGNPHYDHYQASADALTRELGPLIGAANVLPVARVIIAVLAY